MGCEWDVYILMTDESYHCYTALQSQEAVSACRYYLLALQSSIGCSIWMTVDRSPQPTASTINSSVRYSTNKTYYVYMEIDGEKIVHFNYSNYTRPQMLLYLHVMFHLGIYRPTLIY